MGNLVIIRLGKINKRCQLVWAVPLAVLCLPLPLYASSPDNSYRLAFSKKLQVEIFAIKSGGDWCQIDTELEFKSKDPNFFKTNSFRTLVRKFGPLLVRECPKAKTASVKGYSRNEDTLLYKGETSLGTGWKLADLPIGQDQEPKKRNLEKQISKAPSNKEVQTIENVEIDNFPENLKIEHALAQSKREIALFISWRLRKIAELFWDLQKNTLFQEKLIESASNPQHIESSNNEIVLSEKKVVASAIKSSPNQLGVRTLFARIPSVSRKKRPSTPNLVYAQRIMEVASLSMSKEEFLQTTNVYLYGYKNIKSPISVWLDKNNVDIDVIDLQYHIFDLFDNVQTKLKILDTSAKNIFFDSLDNYRASMNQALSGSGATLAQATNKYLQSKAEEKKFDQFQRILNVIEKIKSYHGRSEKFRVDIKLSKSDNGLVLSRKVLDTNSAVVTTLNNHKDAEVTMDEPITRSFEASKSNIIYEFTLELLFVIQDELSSLVDDVEDLTFRVLVEDNNHRNQQVKH